MISVQLAETADKEQIRARVSVCFGDSAPLWTGFSPTVLCRASRPA
jgi:hypothetical protein